MKSCETKKQGKRNGEVRVVIMTKKATNIELMLSYRMFLLVFGSPKRLGIYIFA